MYAYLLEAKEVGEQTLSCFLWYTCISEDHQLSDHDKLRSLITLQDQDVHGELRILCNMTSLGLAQQLQVHNGRCEGLSS